MKAEERSAYMDEADRFYADPVGFIRDEYTMLSAPSRYRPPFKASSPLSTNEPRTPDCLVFFEQLEGAMPGIVQQIDQISRKPSHKEWVPEWRGFNSHFHDDRRRRGDVVVWCLQDAHTG
jgi:phosphatidylinositol glycan class B